MLLNKLKTILKNKKALIFVILLFILLVTGGFFLWGKGKETPEKEWGLARSSRKEDFTIKETTETKIVENEKVGLTFTIPKDWTLKENILPYSSGISFYNPSVEIGEREYIIRKGCKVTADVTNIKVKIDTLENALKKKFSLPSITKDQYERIKIDNRLAIKHVFEEESFEMYVIGVHIPVKNNLYEIVLDAALQDKDYCQEQFNNILETVSIK